MIKLPHDAKVWPFVGLKGGSEDQLMAGNWLMQNKNGRWYTLHLYWNNSGDKVKPDQMISVVVKILSALQAAIK